MAVMPCFDKKLEASRSDFYLNEAETREVDCVITSGTVITLMMLFASLNVEHFLILYFSDVSYRRGSENA